MLPTERFLALDKSSNSGIKNQEFAVNIALAMELRYFEEQSVLMVGERLLSWEMRGKLEKSCSKLESRFSRFL